MSIVTGAVVDAAPTRVMAMPTGGEVAVQSGTALSTADLLVHAYAESARNPNTRAARWSDAGDWCTWLTAGGVRLLEATRRDVEGYVRDLQERSFGAATIGRRLSTVSGLYTRALSEDLVARNPVAFVDRPKLAQDSTSTGLDRSEVAALVTAAGASSDRDYALVLLLALNGLRVSEACGLDVTDLDSERSHRVLRVTRKGGARATVPVGPQLADALDVYIAGRTAGPLFLTVRGGRLDRSGVWRLLRRLATAAGMTKAASVHPHDLRHAFVTLALDAGVPLHRVQDAAGHADPKTTRRYDRARHSLDEHATYALTASLALPRRAAGLG